MVSTSSISAVGLVNQHGLNWKADSSLFNLNYLSLIISGRNREFESTKFHIRALMAKPDIDFADPKWKNKFQESFDRRFDLPHLRDSLEVKPRSTTFSLKSRVPLVDGNGAPEDTWNGYVNDDDRALLKVIKFASPSSAGAHCIDPAAAGLSNGHRAGPRKLIYYEPDDVKAAIVTCGGLCPGLNDIIRQIVLTLEKYGVKKIVGIPFGYRGFFEEGLSEIPSG